MPDPKKFSNFSEMITAIHDLGLYFGLYTSRSNNTCAGFAASCGHEVLDAVAYASWGVDFVKDDSCGYCRDVLSDYSIMQSAIWATGSDDSVHRGRAPIANCSAGGSETCVAWVMISTTGTSRRSRLWISVVACGLTHIQM